MIDGDLNTYSFPVDNSKVDDDGFYYYLHLQRPMDANGGLIDGTDYGTIIKVQLKVVYGLFEGFPLTRFSYIEAEGFNRRFENAGVPGTGAENKITEISNITDALKEWSFSNPTQWDEILLRISSKYDIADNQLFRLYEIQLLVTYIKK